MSRFSAFVLLGLLAGCGFQLQGAFTAPAAMERTYIDASDRHSLFYRDLRAALQAAGVNVVESRAASTATLGILFDDTGQRVLSVSARNVPTEYEVYYTISYTLEQGERQWLDPQTLTVTRNYTYDSTLVLGKAREEEQLRESLSDDLVRLVLKQISTL